MALQTTLLTGDATSFASIALIKTLAFQNNTLSKAMYGNTPASALQKWFVEREMQEALNPCQKVAAVVDTETREVVAYGKWAVPLGYLATRDGGSIERNGRGGNSNQEGERTTPLKLPVPEGIRMDVWATFREELDAMRERYLDPSRDFCLRSLATHPDYQGRGCATMLLKWGLEKADAANAKCYLESTPDAYALYCKYGFHKVDELVTDLRGYGEEDAHVIKIMIREPKSCS